MKKEIIGSCTLYHGDCREILPTIDKVDVIVSDPPYPDYYADEYLYNPEMLKLLEKFTCRQVIFWSAKVEFPLNYSSVHIWDKKCGCGSMYEKIFERNGHKNYKVFRHYLINSTVAASFTKDIFTGHPSQKPIHLIKELVEYTSKPNNIIADPFMGSGTTGVACITTNRQFIGIEINQKYFDISCKRIEEAIKQNEKN